jgi:hypothetical protein
LKGERRAVVVVVDEPLESKKLARTADAEEGTSAAHAGSAIVKRDRDVL